VAEVVASPAVTLFAARAAAASGFVFDVDGAAAAAELCRGVDGLPAGVTLAALPTRVLPAAALSHAVDPTPVPATLGDGTHASVEPAFRLLGADARALLASLVLRPGTFTIDDARATRGPGATHGVMDQIAELVELHLARPDREPAADGTRPRFIVPRFVRDAV